MAHETEAITQAELVAQRAQLGLERSVAEAHEARPGTALQHQRCGPQHVRIGLRSSEIGHDPDERVVVDAELGAGVVAVHTLLGDSLDIDPVDHAPRCVAGAPVAWRLAQPPTRRTWRRRADRSAGSTTWSRCRSSQRCCARCRRARADAASHGSPVGRAQRETESARAPRRSARGGSARAGAGPSAGPEDLHHPGGGTALPAPRDAARSSSAVARRRPRGSRCAPGHRPRRG